MEWTFPLSPIAASRARIGRHGGYYKGPYKIFREQAPIIIYQILGEDFELLIGDLEVEIECVVTRPKATVYDYPTADIDNYLKSIFDILNGKLWVDDKQIVKVSCTKRWAEADQPGYFVVRI